MPERMIKKIFLKLTFHFSILHYCATKEVNKININFIPKCAIIFEIPRKIIGEWADIHAMHLKINSCQKRAEYSALFKSPYFNNSIRLVSVVFFTFSV